MAKDRERDDDEFSDDDGPEAEEDDSPIFDDDDDTSADFDDDPDEEDDDDELAAPRPGRAPPKRTTIRGANVVEGVPRTKLDDPKVAAEVWQKLTDRVKNVGPIPYAMSGRYSPDDIVEHAKFGVGFVISVPGGTKIEVLFNDGVRKLVQGR